MSNLAKKVNNESEVFQDEDLVYRWNNRILVVEDEKDIAEVYRDILSPLDNSNVTAIQSSRSQRSEQSLEKKQEFEIVVCSNPHDALDQVKKAKKQGRPFTMGFFDVLLNDDLDGFELVKEIHKIDAHLYSVFVTAYNDRSVDSISDFLGKDKADRWDYLNKPFSKGEILQKARNFVTLWNLQHEKVVREIQLADANRRLLESERLSAVAAVSRGVSHEFGNILMQIMGKAEICRGKSSDEMNDALEKILNASQRAATILDRFKGLSDHNKKEIVLEDVDVLNLVNEAIDLMDPQFRKAKTKICRIKNDKVTVKGDSTSLLQTVVNLCINSVHAMGYSGQIDVSVIDAGDLCEVKIRDYGPGIKPEILKKVTDAFFTTKGKNGTGLGLSICKEVVEVEHEGKFIVKNHGVQGLEVTIQIPK